MKRGSPTNDAAEQRALVPFPTTRWTLVAGAGGSDIDRVGAMGDLLRRYMPALQSFLRANFRLDTHRSEDLLQGFLTDRVIEQQLLARADRERGRFRTLLATALEHYVISQLRKDAAAKRSPGGGLASLDQANLPPTIAASPTASDAFDVAWARRVVQLAVDQMRLDCDTRNRADLWAVFEGRVLGPTLDDAEPVPLPDLVRQLGITAAQVSNLLGTSKRVFARALRTAVAEYADDGDIDAELLTIKAILAKSTPTAARPTLPLRS